MRKESWVASRIATSSLLFWLEFWLSISSPSGMVDGMGDGVLRRERLEREGEGEEVGSLISKRSLAPWTALTSFLPMGTGTGRHSMGDVPDSHSSTSCFPLELPSFETTSA